MSALTPIITRIKTQLPQLRAVSATTHIDQAISDLKAVYPCAYLFLPRDQAAANGMVNIVSQRVERRFGVLLVVRNVGDMRGEKSFGEIDVLRPALTAALLNWAPAVGFDPIEYSGGELMYYADGLTIWADEFLTRYYLRG